MTAILAGKAAGLASRLLGRGGGTTLPGVVARRIEPNVLRLLCTRLPGGTVLVAGTNGKTTTTRMLAACLSANQHRLLHNRAGANLVSGLTSTALAGANAIGHVQADIGLFEVDEAAFPQALAETNPRLVVLHNLFRDQLDRYGEVDTIAQGWHTALTRLSASAMVLLNADDPAVAGLGEGLQARVFYYGLEDLRHASDSAAHVADSQFCRKCGGRYTYQPRFYAHIGHYHCPQCGTSRPQPHFRLTRLDLDGSVGARLDIATPAEYGEMCEINLPIPGLYNALNALAATSAALLLGLPTTQAAATLAEFSAAFGRIERITAGGQPLLMALIKNPVGASETIRMLVGGPGEGETGRGGDRERGRPGEGEAPAHAHMLTCSHAPTIHLLILINDRHADGTDVSWLWDADFEQLAGHVAHVVVGGTRAGDMAVRLKYAGIDPSCLVVMPDPAQALDAALATTPVGTTLHALPTYTAMLELRAVLAERGWVRPFWED